MGRIEFGQLVAAELAESADAMSPGSSRLQLREQKIFIQDLQRRWGKAMRDSPVVMAVRVFHVDGDPIGPTISGCKLWDGVFIRVPRQVIVGYNMSMGRFSYHLYLCSASGVSSVSIEDKGRQLPGFTFVGSDPGGKSQRLTLAIHPNSNNVPQAVSEMRDFCLSQLK